MSGKYSGDEDYVFFLGFEVKRKMLKLKNTTMYKLLIWMAI